MRGRTLKRISVADHSTLEVEVTEKFVLSDCCIRRENVLLSDPFLRNFVSNYLA